MELLMERDTQCRAVETKRNSINQYATYADGQVDGWVGG